MNNLVDKKITTFLHLSDVFVKHGYHLFLVGGTVRDFLLNLPLTDMDAVTDATPKEMESFIDGDYTFAKYGSIKYKFEDVKFDITTLREEKDYIDYRHPGKIIYVKDLSIDVKRRDFTVNGLYLNNELKVIDYVHGIDDLNKKMLVMIGDPNIRLQEDPLRIIRALRFSIMYDLTIDEKLKKAIKEKKELLNNINIEKIHLDLKKIKNVDEEKLRKIFDEFNLTYVIE